MDTTGKTSNALSRYKFRKIKAEYKTQAHKKTWILRPLWPLNKSAGDARLICNYPSLIREECNVANGDWLRTCFWLSLSCDLQPANRRQEIKDACRMNGRGRNVHVWMWHVCVCGYVCTCENVQIQFIQIQTHISYKERS